MSSRKQQATQKQAAAAQLLQAKQIQFWTRSMARNDADLAAVIDLNRSLHAVKRAFSGKRSSSSRNTSSINMDKNKKKEDALGELLLLDLGAGVYRLAPDGRDTLLKKVPTSSLRPDATPLRKFDPNHDSPNPTNAAADRNKDDSKDDLDANADISSNRQHESPTAAAAAQENDETAALFTLQPILESELSLEKQELCVDFLLRSRLRQKLLSRISRRLLRLATTMESTSSSSTACEAPAPPKYGDLRLHCDAQAVLDFTKPRAAQDAAWIRILAAREAATLQALEQQERENEFDNHKEKDDDDEKEREDKDLQEEPVAMESDLEKKDTEANTEGADEDTRMEEHVTHSDATGNEDDPLAADYAMLKEYKDAYERILIASTITTSLPAGGADESAFCSSTTTLTTQYPIIDPSSTGGVMVEEDWMAIKSGAGGIGATHHNLTAREREVEFNRWKTALLARIPEQPTSAELGLEHRVFLEQQRRERVLRRIQKLKEEEEAGNSLEEDEEEEHENDGEPTELVTDEKSDEEESVDELSGDAAAQQSPVSEKLLDGIKAQANKEDGNIVAVNLAMDENDEQEHVKNDDFDLDGDNNGEIVEEVVADKEADHKIVDKDAEGDVENTQGNITASNDIKKEHEPAKTAEPGEPLASKVVRPISFMATPSFYEQDLKRIKLVHADLMSSSMRDYAVHRLEEATEEFNQGKC